MSLFFSLCISPCPTSNLLARKMMTQVFICFKTTRTNVILRIVLVSKMAADWIKTNKVATRVKPSDPHDSVVLASGAN